jgi:hypothetical protein
MRRMTMLALASVMAAAAVPAAAYYWPRGGDDPLGDTLRGYGMVPIAPPSMLMNVGSLYYVDAAVRDFKLICAAEKADLDGAVKTSRSWEMQQSLERKGRFATDVKVDLGFALDGDVGGQSVQAVHFSLTDVTLEEISLGANWLIFNKLMAKPECNRMAVQHLHAGGYVCQGQKILRATAEFKLGSDTESKLKTKAKVTADEVKDIVKHALETQGDQSVVEQSGRLYSGSALNYGVSMNPLCMSPVDAHFQRVLPRTAFDRVYNFVLLDILEPILPAKSEEPQVADATPALAGHAN